ncbi:MAG: type II secretion system minor pseudopilin GspJ [Desulfobulbaceae bacterium]|nr:type II secretion system minor pseudopilin GspJ [Desulfobulbaceae bacterium]
MSGKNRQHGFTLLELLVALAIFALIATAIYSSLAMLITTSTRLDEAGKSLRELQTTMRILERDLIQVSNRPVRGGYDEELPALRWPGAEEQLELTSGGRSNPLHQSRCNLQRVAYRVKDSRLERLLWPVLDQAQDSKPFVQPLLSGVSRLEVSFQSGKEQLFSDWPPANPPPGKPPLPQAVRVVLEVKEWGRLERIFLLPGGA